eukprot:2628533-Rhodomonas_salina.1
MAESHQSKQYLYDFELDHNDSEVNKVQNALLCRQPLPFCQHLPEGGSCRAQDLQNNANG